MGLWRGNGWLDRRAVRRDHNHHRHSLTRLYPVAPQRGGGFLGRAVAQNRTGEFEDNALPLFWQMLIQVPSWIVMLGVTWIIAGTIGRARPGWSLRGEPLDVARGMGSGFVLQIPIVIIVATIVMLIFGEQIPSARPQALVDAINNPLDLIALVGVVVVGAPIVEELFYRGVVQPSLVRRFGPIVGIGITGVIFGAVHFSLVDLAPLSVVGIGFGILAHKYGRLLPAIVAHMTFNAVALIAVLAAA